MPDAPFRRNPVSADSVGEPKIWHREGSMTIPAFRMDDITPNTTWESFHRREDVFLSWYVSPRLEVVPNSEDARLAIARTWKPFMNSDGLLDDR
jgi:hypothetical protein